MFHTEVQPIATNGIGEREETVLIYMKLSITDFGRIADCFLRSTNL